MCQITNLSVFSFLQITKRTFVGTLHTKSRFPTAKLHIYSLVRHFFIFLQLISLISCNYFMILVGPNRFLCFQSWTAVLISRENDQIAHRCCFLLTISLITNSTDFSCQITQFNEFCVCRHKSSAARQPHLQKKIVKTKALFSLQVWAIPIPIIRKSQSKEMVLQRKKEYYNKNKFSKYFMGTQLEKM